MNLLPILLMDRYPRDAIWGIMNKVVKNILTQVFLQTYVYIYFG